MASSLSSAAILLLFSAAVFMILLTPPVFAANRLDSGQILAQGQSLTQASYVFVMQRDCNLVLYDSNKPVWSTDTAGRGSFCFLYLQFDGNLVIYNGIRIIWTSNSNRRLGSFSLFLQSDRNVVIYDSSNKAIWSTGTSVARAANLLMPQNNCTAAELYR